MRERNDAEEEKKKQGRIIGKTILVAQTFLN